MPKKKYKIIVAGLPKTGTSTLATMFNILNYDVIGPSINLTKDNTTEIEYLFQKHQAFQDYPWCFEWKRFFERDDVKVVILKRDINSWFESFLMSYGKKGKNYKSFPYLRIEKSRSNETKFREYFNNYYRELEVYQNKYPDKFLSVQLEDLKWDTLCSFLSESIPTDFSGRKIKVPHSNKSNYLKKRNRKSIQWSRMKNLCHKIFGKKIYELIRNFYLKNIKLR